MCSPLKREARFWKPTLSNRPSKFHFLEDWMLQMSTHWSIFLALIALKLFFRRFSASVAHPNFEKSSAKRVVFAQGAVLQNDIIYHTCNFVNFWCLVPFAACFWWLYTHFFTKVLSRLAFFFVFLQKYAPRSSGKQIFETQLWGIGVQKCIFCSPEGLCAIFLALIALLAVRFVSVPLQLPPKNGCFPLDFHTFRDLTPQVTPKWCKRTLKWPQSDPNVAQSDPKTTQSNPNVTQSLSWIWVAVSSKLQKMGSASMTWGLYQPATVN